MENFEGNYSRETKIKHPLEIKAQRLSIGGSRSHGGTLSPTRFDTENVSLNSPILRYLCGGGGSRSPISAGNLGTRGSRSPLSAGNFAPRGSRSPLSAVENYINRSPPPSTYRTPVKVVDGEEVLVMDGLPFKRRSRFSGSESSGSSGKSLFKADIFESSEISGDLRQSPKIQLSRTKEDQRPTRLAIKNLAESQFNGSSNHDIRGLFNLSPDSLFLPQTLSPTEPPRTPVRSVSPTEPMPPRFTWDYTPRAPRNDADYFLVRPVRAVYEAGSYPLLQYLGPPTQMEPLESQTSFRMAQEEFPALNESLKKKPAINSAPASQTTTEIAQQAPPQADWLPEDDGIIAEAVAGTIDSVQLAPGHCRARRLPVFSELCPDS